ncbi:glycosyltransferase [Tunicatimonas pelagia]|uniref:glycosyltransferase n=1 Tax=Tunicatimonas pelagia TaxID=931531 RepID=UPI0026668737|nr:glycosyltransferase [Tunicatimonas pelagia]WKN44320.1 glycosyltransferase [Tunicatimonas pelagia]
MEVIFTIFVLIYCLLVVRFHYYWLQIPVFHPQPAKLSEQPLRASVIIPVRNEARHIVSLLQDLEKQRLNEQQLLPKRNWEVIVVDDASEDETATLVRNFASQTELTITLIPSDTATRNRSPKKQAIWQGIQSSQGDYIITTDGDCRVEPYWLLTWLQFLQQYRPALAAGGVTFHQEKTWFQRLQTIEFASLIGMSAASIQTQHPITCNGANLAFSRSAFRRVGGYQGHWHVPSGDDEFLLHAVFREYPKGVFFLKSPEAVVKTYAKRTVTSFIQQRKRWAGKWKMHREAQVVLLSLLVFIFHVGFLSGLIYFTLGVTLDYWLVGLLFLKVGVEWAFLKSVLRFLKKKENLINLLPLQLLYSAYFILIGLIASGGGYTWKNRKHHQHD